MTAFMTALFAGRVAVYGLRGEPVSTGTNNPLGRDAYAIDTAEALRVIATVLPDAVSPAEVAFRVQIVNPTGDPALTEAAIVRLAFAGVGVVLVRELAGIPTPATTEVSLGGAESIDDVKPYLDTIGKTELVPLGEPDSPHERVVGIHVNVVLGRSFMDLVDRQSTATTVTGISTETTDTEAAG
jgi:hypothetical protein